MAATLSLVERKEIINVDEDENVSIMCAHLGRDSKEIIQRFQFRIFQFSNSTRIKDVKKELVSHWNIDKDDEDSIVETRLWMAYLGSPWKLVRDESVDIQDLHEEFNKNSDDEDNNNNIQLILECRKSSRKYQLDFLNQQQEEEEEQQRKRFYKPYYERIDYTKNSGDGKKNEPGVCGLVNIGNTCYMNSTIQCLSKIKSLREYFVETEEYSTDLKSKNQQQKKKTKKEGETIGKAFKDLMTMIWSGKHTEITPRGFKYRIGKKNEIFSGYRQQDSHELLSFLLTSLHCDLYVKKKKASIISDTFRGQCLDTLTCPKCNWSRRRLGSFTSLSLPIPHEEPKKSIEVTVIFNNLNNNNNQKQQQQQQIIYKKPKKYQVEVFEEVDLISNLRKNLSKLSGIEETRLLICEIYKHEIYKQFQLSDPVNSIQENDNIYAFEMNNNNNNNKKKEKRIIKNKNNNNKNKKFIEFHIIQKEEQKKFNWYGRSSLEIVSKEVTDFPILMNFPDDNKKVSTKYLYDQCFENIFKKIINHLPQDDQKKEEEEEKETETETEQQQQHFVLEIRTDDDNNKSDEYDFYSFNNSKKKKKNSNILEYSNDQYVDIPEKIDLFEHSTTTRSFIFDDSEEEEEEEEPQKIIIDMVLPPLTSNEKKYNFSVFESTKQQEKQEEKKDVIINNNITLDDCVDLFCEPEILTEDNLFKCPRCKKKVQAVKKIDLYKLPKILIIQLKRFKQKNSNNGSSSSSSSYYFGNYFNSSNTRKIEEFVDFQKNLDLKKHIVVVRKNVKKNNNNNNNNEKYELFGVVNHYGSLEGGHYNAFCCNKEEKEDHQKEEEDSEERRISNWKKYDDRRVVSYNNNNKEEVDRKIFSSNAYLLFYKAV